MQKIKLFLIALSLTFLGAACTPGSLSPSQPDGGIWYSLDKGENWQMRGLVFADSGGKKDLSDVDIKKLVLSPQDSRKLFAVSAGSGLWISWNAGNNWDLSLSAQDVNDVALHPADKKIFYVAVGTSIAKTANEGDTYRAVYTNDQKQNLVLSLALSSANPNILYAGTSLGEVLFSENAGVAWRQVAKLGGRVEKLAVHPGRENLLYAGVAGKGLAQSANGGKDWGFFDEAFKDYQGINNFRDFVLTPTGLVYASQFGLLRTLDQGKNWTKLPLISSDRDSNIYALALNPKNPLEVYYGTRSTFYRSIDGGFNWIPRQLPSTRAATAILVDPENTEMVYLGVSRLR